MTQTGISKESAIHELINEVMEFVKHQAEQARSPLSMDLEGDADSTERGIFERVLEVGGMLMEYYFEELGPVDMGREIEVEGKRFTREVCSDCSHLTVFGEIGFKRYCYYSADGESIKPLDTKANLPDRQASYFVQDLLSRLGVKYATYDESKQFLRTCLATVFQSTRWSK